MSHEFKDKVALVTGAAGGIGSATARMLASRGASVALLDLADATCLAGQLSAEYHVKSQFFHVDVSDAQAVENTFASVLAWSGKLDVCVNAAGIFPPGNSIDATPIEQWSRIVSVNLNGTFYCLQQEIQAFKKQGTSGGAIANLSSDAGSVAMAGCAAYVASKHGINGLTKTAALEYAKEGIRINAISPGNIDTPMVQQFGVPIEDIGRTMQPGGRCGRPEEVAELVCFLLSDRSPFMTGSIVAIDGGITTAGYGSGAVQDTFSS